MEIERLKKLLRLLDSGTDGEALAACRAIVRLGKKEFKNAPGAWHSFVDSLRIEVSNRADFRVRQSPSRSPSDFNFAEILRKAGEELQRQQQEAFYESLRQSAARQSAARQKPFSWAPGAEDSPRPSPWTLAKEDGEIDYICNKIWDAEHEVWRPYMWVHTSSWPEAVRLREVLQEKARKAKRKFAEGTSE